MPLWSCYLVKVYAWRTMLSADGVINWALGPLGHPRARLRHHRGLAGDELPVAAVHDPADLRRARAHPQLPARARRRTSGPRPFTTFRRVILPLAFPAVVAGSIFTFSLTLGDYITPRLVSNTQFIGNVVYQQHHQQPAARRRRSRCVPIVVMVVYLLVARRLGAFEHLYDAALARLAESRSAIARRGDLAFIYIPLIVIAIYAFNSSSRPRVAAAEPHARTGSRRRSRTGRARRVGHLAEGRRRRDRASRWSSGRWPRSRSPATGSSGARPCRSWSSCRSRCRASSPASRSATPSPRCSASTSACSP